MNIDIYSIRARRFLPALMAAIIASSFAGCGDQPLLTELETNKLMIIIKGTYESNGPQPWSMPAICATYDGNGVCTSYTTEHLNQVRDDSIQVCTGDSDSCMGDVNPTAFMLDIAEMKLLGKDFKTHYKFANTRQTFAFSFNDLEPFFSGLGTMMSNDDVPADMYPAILIYVRKMLMDGAIKFIPASTGWGTSPVWDVFAEKAIPSFNFNQFQVNSYYDTLRLEGAMLNRVFPLFIPIRDAMESWVFNKKFPYVVLEIRFVVKNYVKKYEYENYDGNIYGVVHYYAFSDWLHDVQNNETAIGGNILTVARCYIPGMVGEIRGINNLGHAAHIIAIPASDNINNYMLDPTGFRSQNNCNVPRMPGAYIGPDFSQHLDIRLRSEKVKYDWNKMVPSKCISYDTYIQGWDSYISKTGGFMIPALATYAASGQSYGIENVPPGAYKVYISNVAPSYGKLYQQGNFNEYPNNPVTVTIGGFSDNMGNSTSIDFW